MTRDEGLARPFAHVVLMSLAAAILYGVLHDQVTARVCVEYFTVGHAPVFDTTDPTLLGLGWGVIATWWVGLLLGVPLALVTQAGARPRTPPAELWRAIGLLLVGMGLCAAVAGKLGLEAARSGDVVVAEELASRIAADRHHSFIACAWAHGASYAVGFIGGACVIAWAGIQRTRRPLEAAPSAPAAQLAPVRAAALVQGLTPVVAPEEPSLAVVLAHLVVVPQVGMVLVAALCGLAPLVGSKPSIAAVRLTSGVLAAVSLGLGAWAWKRQHIVSRAMTVLLALPALFLVIACAETILLR